MKRFLFDNLVYRLTSERYMLFNLLSYRRQVIDIAMLHMLECIDDKLSLGCKLDKEERVIYEKLLQSKQVLGEDITDIAFTKLRDESTLQLSHYPVRTLTFNLTHKCNFNCYYCYQNNYKYQDSYSGHMTIVDIKLINEYIQRAEFDANKIEEVVISGGEPLLNENISTINCILDTFAVNRKVMFTNGVNILRFRDKIDFSKIDEFQVSLDGGHEVVNEVNNYSGDFQVILKGINYLLTLGKKVSLVTMWTRQLEQHLESFISIIKKSDFHKFPNFQMKIVVAKDFHNNNNLDERIYNYDYIIECRRKYNRMLLDELHCSIELFSEAGLLATLLHRPKNERAKTEYKRCNIAKTIPMVFEPNGEVHWCMCLGHSNGLIGNYRKNTIDLEKIKLLGNRSIFTIEKCKTCKLKYICRGGCVLGLIGRDTALNEPSCSLFENAFFWDHLEELL